MSELYIVLGVAVLLVIIHVDALFDHLLEAPALIEKYLPYALALEVEKQGSERFAATLAAAASAGRAP